MTKDEVLQTLIKLFKSKNAVDPNLSDREIAQIKLTGLAWFGHDLGLDPDFKKEVLFKMTENALKNAHPKNVNPVISPQDESVFDKDITIDQLADEIAEDTPDQII